MDIHECGPDDIQLNVNSDDWQDYVDAFKKKLDQTPNPAGPPTAVFELEKDQKLCVTKFTTFSLADSTMYSEVAKRSFVDDIYRLLPEDNQDKEPYSITVIAVVDGKEKPYSIRLAGIKFKSKDELAGKKGGVIHNPPRSEQ